MCSGETPVFCLNLTAHYAVKVLLGVRDSQVRANDSDAQNGNIVRVGDLQLSCLTSSARESFIHEGSVRWHEYQCIGDNEA